MNERGWSDLAFLDYSSIPKHPDAAHAAFAATAPPILARPTTLTLTLTLTLSAARVKL